MENNAWDGGVPECLLNSENFAALNLTQQRNFSSRLRYIDEIRSTVDGIESLSDTEILDLIDGVELDALSILSLGDRETAVSPYIIHSSWTFDCDGQVLLMWVPAVVSEFLASTSSCLVMSKAGAKLWLSNWSRTLQLTLSGFARSSTLPESITHLIVLDAIVSSFLIFAATARIANKFGS
jgi:hypothetical protein